MKYYVECFSQNEEKRFVELISGLGIPVPEIVSETNRYIPRPLGSGY